MPNANTKRGPTRFLTGDKTNSHVWENLLHHSCITKRTLSNDMGQKATGSATSATNLQQTYFAKYQTDMTRLLQIGRLFQEKHLWMIY